MSYASTSREFDSVAYMEQLKNLRQGMGVSVAEPSAHAAGSTGAKRPSDAPLLNLALTDQSGIAVAVYLDASACSM